MVVLKFQKCEEKKQKVSTSKFEVNKAKNFKHL